MTIPSKKAQVQAIMKYLDSDYTEGKSLEQIATAIVDGYTSLMGLDIKEPALAPHEGMAFKHPALSGVWHIAYIHEGECWIVSATTNGGGFIRQDSEFWRWAEPSKAKAGEPGNNKEWKAGENVSRRQRQFVYEILATGDKCVLLKDVRTGSLQAESNSNMEKYYRREVNVKVADLEW